MDAPYFTIDTLNLRLPAGFAHRADAIARQVGRELARRPISGNVQLATLQLPQIAVYGGESNQAVARRIAQSIHRQIHRTSLNQGLTHGAD